jgi:outer membrane protein
VNSRIIVRTAALAASCLVGAAAGWAQSPAPAGSSSSAKVGIVDVRNAIVTTAEGKQASAELQSQFASRQSDLENLNKQINDTRQRLQACEGKCSQEEMGRLQRQGESYTRQLERKQNEYQQDLNDAQGEVIDRIGRKLVDVLDRYARENGYAVVLDSSAQNSPILYKSNQVDVTGEIVRLYDQAYPVKGGAPAAAPAKPKPATNPPAKPPQK